MGIWRDIWDSFGGVPGRPKLPAKYKEGGYVKTPSHNPPPPRAAPLPPPGPPRRNIEPSEEILAIRAAIGYGLVRPCHRPRIYKCCGAWRIRYDASQGVPWLWVVAARRHCSKLNGTLSDYL